jgi:peroxiredoxin
MPHLRELYARLRPQGFQLIAVNEGDPAKTILDYAKTERLTFPMVRDDTSGHDITKRYGVQAFPTSYVLDGNGKIVATFVGFDEAGMKAALKKLGFKL